MFWVWNKFWCWWKVDNWNQSDLWASNQLRICTKGLILHKEGNVYTKRWERSPILWAPFEKQMIDSKKVLFLIRTIQGSSHLMKSIWNQLIERISYSIKLIPDCSQKLLHLSWEVFNNLPYSSDIAPSVWEYS